MTSKALPVTDLEHDLVQNITEAQFIKLSLGAFLRCEQFGLIHDLPYLWLVHGCWRGRVLLYIMLDLVKLWYALRICRLAQTMAMAALLTFVTIRRLTATARRALDH